MKREEKNSNHRDTEDTEKSKTDRLVRSVFSVPLWFNGLLFLSHFASPTRSPRRRRRRRSSAACAIAWSGRSAADAPVRSPACRASRCFSTSARPAAASGARPTAATPGRTSPTASSAARSAPSPSANPTRASSTSAAARRPCAATCRTATACGNRWTPARPGSTSAWPTAGISPASASIRRTRTSSTRPCSGISSARTRSAASIARTDGGATWKQVLFVNDEVGAVDLVLDPTSPAVMYASTWRVKRHAVQPRKRRPRLRPVEKHRRRRHWTEIIEEQGHAASDDRHHRRQRVAGRSRARLGARRGRRRRRVPLRRRRQDLDEDQRGSQPPPAGLVLHAHLRRIRRTRTRCTSSTSSLMQSVDGGKTFAPIRTPHGDHHDLWIDPTEPSRMIVGDDGGAQVSHERRRRVGPRIRTSRPRSSTA